jgi:hypothetical protein
MALELHAIQSIWVLAFLTPDPEPASILELLIVFGLALIWFVRSADRPK